MHDEGIDLIVVNYQTVNDLADFVESYRQFTPQISHTLFVVNVAPRQEDDDFFVPEALMFRHVQNIGYARAVNHAVDCGQREALGVFNADVLLTEGSVDACYEYLMSKPEYAVVGPLQTDLRGKVTHGGFFMNDWGKMYDRGWQHSPNETVRDVREDAATVSGSAYFTKRRIWDEMIECPIYAEVYSGEGAFLPTQHFFEETWYSFHVRSHGYKVVYNGNVEMKHKWHQASPVGGSYTRAALPEARTMFCEMCELHGVNNGL